MRLLDARRRPLTESVKDYSLAIALFVFGLFLIWLAYYFANLFAFIAGICSILASFVIVISNMGLLDPKSPKWAIRHIYVFTPFVGLLFLALLYPISYLAQKLVIDEGTEVLFGSLLFGLGSGLIIISPILAIGYMLIRRGASLNALKLKGSNVA